MFGFFDGKRGEALKRIGIGVIFIPLYAAILFPAAFAVAIVLAIVDVGYILVTGEKPDYAAKFIVDIWDWTGGNVKYLLSGHGEFHALPRPVRNRELRA